MYEYEDCRGQYQQSVGVASGAIPDSAITASSQLAKRPAVTARLNDQAGKYGLQSML